MKTLTIASLQRPLTVLEVAEENLLSTGTKLSSALAPYENERREVEHQIHELNLEIDAIVEASHEDPAVVTLTDEHDEWQVIYSHALEDVRIAALSAWEMQIVEVKQWRQGEWEVKLKTTLTPVVTEPLKFLSRLDEISAEGIVKTVKFTLHKKATVDLDERVGLRGLRVDEKTSVSVTRVGVTEED